MKSKIHIFVSITFALFITLPSQARGLRENFIHPDKLIAKEYVSLESFTLTNTSDDCSSGCSAACVQFARRIISDCGSTPPSGGVDRPDFQLCVSTMKTFFSARSGTSGSQDSADAIAYCVSGASTTCPDELNTAYFSKRSGTSGAQDRTDAARACQNGVSLSCMQVVHGEYSRRSGTSSTQDVNDAVAACQRSVQ